MAKLCCTSTLLLLLFNMLVHLSVLQSWKYRFVIDTTFFAFQLSIIADSLLSIYSIDYCRFYAFCLHIIDW